MESGSWIASERFRPTATVRLFCFPYMGGGASVYKDWADLLPDFVEVCALQPPGREDRIHEPAILDKDQMFSEMIDVILARSDKPFVFYGHSIGGGISIHLAEVLAQEYGKTPAHVMIGALPHITRFPQALTQLFGGIADEITEDWVLDLLEKLEVAEFLRTDPEWVREVMPAISADAHIVKAMLDTQQTNNITESYPFPLTVFAGQTDSLYQKEHMLVWKNYLAGDRQIPVKFLPGGHLFISERKPLKALIKLVTEIVEHVNEEGGG
ncbi:thioesterase II family protein [Candidatus Latescibacterota bacterium]